MREHSVPLLTQATGFARFALGVRPFLRTVVSVDEARSRIRVAMQDRELRFLQMVQRVVFANPRSPYLALLRHAGCDQQDLEQLVKREGLEGALQQLFSSGVYVDFEEFKGRIPAVRGSATFHFQHTDFDNPLTTGHFSGSTGGSSGRSGRVRFDLQHIEESAPHWAAWLGAHGIENQPLIYWTPMYAALASGQLRYAKVGLRFVKWFCMGGGGDAHDRMVQAGVHGLLQWVAGFPRPEIVPLNRPDKVAEYLGGMVKQGTALCVAASPSASARISLAAQERDVSLAGVSFLLRAEPLTTARRAVIEASDGRAIQTYGFSEGGTVGSQCPQPTEADDIHVYRDAYAIIGRDFHSDDGAPASALLFTALRPSCPKVLINTDIGDYATMETRRCGCLLDELGYDLHLHTVRSYQKLTGEGVTFYGADVYRILEETLPRRFGGNLTHYQLIEDQDSRALPHYTLRVHPEVGPVDQEALKTAFLRELGGMRGVYETMASVWDQGELLQVSREPPAVTARGKALPYMTLQRR